MNGGDTGLEFFRCDRRTVVSSGEKPFGVEGPFLLLVVVVDAHGEVAKYMSRSAPTSSSLVALGVAGARAMFASLEGGGGGGGGVPQRLILLLSL